MTDNAKDDPRDAHLLAALRHAPDRDATPPREVTRRLLDAARAAVRPAPWWQRLSAWLMQPQVAASFGTLVVASLVGVLWSTREPPVAEFTPAPAVVGSTQRPLAPAPIAASQTDAEQPEASAAAPTSAVASQARTQATPALRPKQAPAKDAAARSRAATEPPADTAALRSSSQQPPPAVAAAPGPQAADTAERRSVGPGESRLLERRSEAAPAPDAAGAMDKSLAAKAAADPLARWDAVLNSSAPESARWRVGDRPPMQRRRDREADEIGERERVPMGRLHDRRLTCRVRRRPPHQQIDRHPDELRGLPGVVHALVHQSRSHVSRVTRGVRQSMPQAHQLHDAPRSARIFDATKSAASESRPLETWE